MSDPTTEPRNGLRGPWYGDAPAPVIERPTALGRVLMITRGLGIISVLLIGVMLIIPMRWLERLISGARRPWTGPWVQGVCRLSLWILGLKWHREGVPMRGPGAVVANHSSWLDILVLNAAMPVFFVSKAEVATWPGINVLTRVTDTHFVTRDPKLARAQAEEFASRTRAGHRLLFFPEGTSTDGRRVLPFKPTLFQGFLAPELPKGLAIQPMTAVYHAPEGRDPRFYGWYGHMSLGPHLIAVLSQVRQGSVTVRLHPPIPVEDETRKTLSAKAESAVRNGFEKG
ncbi:lysophospholipid acyltransferase family protein [Paracoccus sp. MBLB3053]|uniref:Lysophospholipid acyltransferase family protein n=1 Tax=Paracoccus aurantius TaxID=3073814 RepID=A0ABU2HUJ8_9RHOB|nr:lysophospholipid acyltransferase family protein [Paracoccus sp. MBLB3053]MDS9468711.1 lysophospholipid acyltransferase family protein [Paracoccus sp. MBLB3053]